MSLLTEPLAQLEAAIADLETRVAQKVADAEKKDVPTPEELAKLTELLGKLNSIAQ